MSLRISRKICPDVQQKAVLAQLPGGILLQGSGSEAHRKPRAERKIHNRVGKGCRGGQTGHLRAAPCLGTETSLAVAVKAGGRISQVAGGHRGRHSHPQTAPGTREASKKALEGVSELGVWTLLPPRTNHHLQTEKK